MAVLLEWINRVQGDGIRVYRSPDPIVLSDLPTPLATLAADVSQYLDEDASGAVHYAVSAYKGAAEKFAFVSATAAEAAPLPSSTKIANLKGAWGTVLRVDGYTGPAIKVRDHAGVGPDVDLYFNAQGFVTDPAPYADTRVIRIYDQLGGGHDLISTPYSVFVLPTYLPADSGFRTARISRGAASYCAGFRDVLGGSASHPYCVVNPIFVASLHYLADGPYRAIGGVWGGTSFNDKWRYGGHLDNTKDSLYVIIEDGVASSIGTPGYSLSDDHYKLVFDYQSSPAYYYLNGVTVGTKGWTPGISYPSGSRFCWGGVMYNSATNMEHPIREDAIEMFVLSHADAPTTDAIELQGYLAEARA